MVRAQYADAAPKLVIVGQQARQFAHGYAYEVEADFSHIPDPLSFADSLPISKLLMEGFESMRYRSVRVGVYGFCINSSAGGS